MAASQLERWKDHQAQIHNKATCKFKFTNQLSCVLYSFQKLAPPFRNDLQVVVTFDPNKFAEKKQQRLHISNLRSFGAHVSLLKQPTPVVALHIDYDTTHKTQTRESYPPDTKAFLYYFMLPEKPRIVENYASKLHQVTILRLLRVDQTSCYQMVSHARVYFILFQNIIFLCMTNCMKIDMFQMTWTKFYCLCPREDSAITGVIFIH